MAAVQVLLAGHDVTQYLQAGSISIRRAANGQVGTAQFRLTEPVSLLDGARVDLAEADEDVLADPVLAGIVASHAEVEIRLDGVAVFRGTAAQVSVSIDSAYVRYQVACQDVIARLQRVMVTQKSFASTTAGAIVAWLIAQAADALSQDASFVLDASAVDKFEIRGQSVAQALTTLADLVGAAWYVDVDGRLHWRPRTNPEDSGLVYGVAAGEKVLAGSLSVDHDASSLANRVRVLAQEALYESGTVSLAGAGQDDDQFATSTFSYWGSWQGQSIASADNNNLPLLVERQEQLPQTFEYSYSLALTGAYLLYGGPNDWDNLQLQAVFATNAIKVWSGSGYQVRSFTASWAPTLPPDGTVIALQVQVDTGVSLIDAGDNVSVVFIEKVDSVSNNPVRDPQGPYVTAFPGAVIPFNLPVDWYSWPMHFRIGWLGGPPGGYNAFTPVSVTLKVTVSVPQQPLYRITRAWLRFPTQNQLPAGAGLSGARLRLRLAGKTGNPSLRIRRSSLTSWPPQASGLQAETGEQVALLGPDQIPAAGQWMEITLPPNSIRLDGQTVLCLDPAVGSAAPAAGWEVLIRAWEAGTADRPQLLLDWQKSIPAVEFTAEDEASIQQFGLRAMAIFDSRLTQQQCEQLARKELAQRAWPRRSIRLATMAGTGLEPGRLVDVQFDDVGVWGRFIVQDLSVKIDRAGNAVWEATLEKFRPDLIQILLETRGN